MSTLFVDTINEKTSGNGIQIPGHIVQVVNATNSSQVAVSSTSAYTDLLSCAITTKYANSIIMVQGCVPNYSNNGNANSWTNSHYIRLNESGGDGIVAGYEHPGPHTSMEFSQVSPVLYISGAKSVGTYTYVIQVVATVGGDTHYFGRTTGSAPSYTRMVVMEIAQ